MKTELEINNSILLLTNEITNKYPELLKYIGEMPIKDVFEQDFEINKKNLLDYYNTLKTIFDDYALNHTKNK